MTTICAVDGCSVGAWQKGLCARHYTQLRTIEAPRCTRPGCNGYQFNRTLGVCSLHYGRVQRTGQYEPLTIEDRFWSKVNKEGPVSDWRPDLGPCWLWTAGTVGGDYPIIWVSRNKNEMAYRFAYRLLVGPIPDGLHLDHLCRVRRCVRPAHLEPVTMAENNRRAGAVRTHCPHGHEYTPENTYRSPNGGRRQCRECNRQRWVRQNAAAKERRQRASTS